MKQRRETIQRQAILDVLKNTSAHPTADTIFEEVRRKIPSISKGTVYRNLKVLRETGRVTELNLEGTVSRYEYRYDRHPHFRCDRCGCVIDLDSALDSELDRKAVEATGLQIDYHQLEFRGLCRDCREGDLNKS